MEIHTGISLIDYKTKGFYVDLELLATVKRP